VKQELGVAFSIGLIRHIVATMLYESSPQAGPVAQRLLGHTSIKTTEMLYGHLTTRSAHATWAKVIEKQRRRTDPARGKR
jgi:integrase